LKQSPHYHIIVTNLDYLLGNIALCIFHLLG
jgi:hypothetical protein